MPPQVNTAVKAVATPNYGEVFTKRWVVDFILDLCGYTADRDLASLKAIEPACGSGAFLIPMIERLAQSARKHKRDLRLAPFAIQATDLLSSNVRKSRYAVTNALVATGLERAVARSLAKKWIRQGDFLLDPPTAKSADFVIGNPPYIRLEQVPAETSAAYRRTCPCMGGRSDVYVGFYERGLHALTDGGTLGFICADRWMRNAYGARLRALIASEWTVDVVVSMNEVDAFEEEVDAYPAVTIMCREKQRTGPLFVDADPAFGSRDAKQVSNAHRRSVASSKKRFRAAQLPSWFEGGASWPLGSPAQLQTIAEIESRLPTLEDETTQTTVGIGLATGADQIFITRDQGLVEPERLLPLAMVRDIANGKMDWSGHHLVNPWDEEGLVDLDLWPDLKRYLTRHKPALRRRHTAKSGKWHKTIDRVVEGLATKPKLYLPDFKESLFPVLDQGNTYPHHNLYWVTSDGWDLEVLGGILLSDIANLFVSAYSVRMRGGYLRFQAQYLRRIRLPEPGSVDRATAKALRRAFRTRNQEAATTAALPLYGVDRVPD